jgi:hypothetical protein
MYRIVDIELASNEHGQLRKDVLYAQLIDEQGNTVVSATLDYILAAIRDRNLQVDGVTVKRNPCRRATDNIICTRTKLTRY